MLIRIFFVAVIFGIAYLILRGIVYQMNANNCLSCEGQGYWKGTRGEKNICKTCDGSGKKK